MLNTVYEKPKMEFVNVQNENKIANTCWGHHNKGTTLYCDLPGEGWCSFQIARGNCSLNLINIQYYQSENTPGIPANEDQISSLTSILVNSGGTDGNPYAGEGSTIYRRPPRRLVIIYEHLLPGFAGRDALSIQTVWIKLILRQLGMEA